MTNKELKIVIADTHLPKLIQLEKSLNGLGYFKILPLQHFDDLRALDHELVEPFDVIIANKALVLGNAIHSNVLWQALKRINYALLYDDQKTLLGDDTMRRVMARIDPPSPWECLKDLTWIKFKSNERQGCPCQTVTCT